MKRIVILLLIFCMLVPMVGCDEEEVAKLPIFAILATTELADVYETVHDFGKQNGYNVILNYEDSVQISNHLKEEDFPYDAVWTSSGIWLNDKCKQAKSIMTSPMVLGIKRGAAEQLGYIKKDWLGSVTKLKDNVIPVQEAADLIKNNSLNVGVASPVLSNSGVATLQMFTSQETITPDFFKKPEAMNVKPIFDAVDKFSGSSAWLRDWVVGEKGNAFMGYEVLAIQAALILEEKSKTPYYLLYPQPNLVADFPFAVVTTEQPKIDFFNRLQAYLLEGDRQSKLSEMGYRTSNMSSDAKEYVFKKDFGVDFGKTVKAMNTSYEASKATIDFFKSKLSKPRFTAYLLDMSGSMMIRGRKEAAVGSLDFLLADEDASKYGVEAGKGFILPYDSRVWDSYNINTPEERKIARDAIEKLEPKGSCDFYSALIRAMEKISTECPAEYKPMVVVVLDGNTDKGKTYQDFENYYKSLNREIPVAIVAFGDKLDSNADKVAALTGGCVLGAGWDPKQSMITALGWN